MIDLCEKKFSFIDMDDFCALGVLRGGMTTYMSARQDKRIKKIVVVSGIGDLLSAYEERDDLREMIRTCLGGTPEEKPEEYKKRSALYWTDEIKIPVLIVHSKQDVKTRYETQAEKVSHPYTVWVENHLPGREIGSPPHRSMIIEMRFSILRKP